MLTSNSVKEDSMVAKASIIEIYARADASGRVDIICKNYSNFIGIVDGYTEGAYVNRKIGQPLIEN